MRTPSSHLPTRRTFCGLLVAASCPGRPAWAQAPQDWPRRTIRIVVPYPAGGSPDVATRMLAEQLAPLVRTPVIVEAKPGASGLIGMRSVTGSGTDGHTLAYVSSGQVTLSAMTPRFDLLQELRPIVRVSSSPFAVLVGAHAPYRTLPELVAALRTQPGKLSYGTAGPGSPSHMAVAHLEDALQGFQALHVPYKGAVESINALLGGQIDFTISVLGAALPHLKTGRLRLLAITSAQRSALLPDAPTVAEITTTRYAFDSWGGFMAAAGTADETIDRLARGLAQAARSAAFTQYLASTGGELALSSSPAQFLAQLQSALATERRMVQQLGLRQGE